MLGFAVGEIGLSLKEFYSLTFREYHHIAKGYLRKDEREWERVRWQTTYLVNLQIKEHKDPTDLLKLPSDRLIPKPKKIIPSKDEIDAQMAKIIEARKNKKV